ncbi:MAG: hypothetical protein JSV80_08660 [Acidobacteriota bacterium]|nr:MAG: hypothetical protein JSV80_08660 [Acidobacteriota bacterium]
MWRRTVAKLGVTTVGRGGVGFSFFGAGLEEVAASGVVVNPRFARTPRTDVALGAAGEAASCTRGVIIGPVRAALIRVAVRASARASAGIAGLRAAAVGFLRALLVGVLTALAFLAGEGFLLSVFLAAFFLALREDFFLAAAFFLAGDFFAGLLLPRALADLLVFFLFFLLALFLAAEVLRAAVLRVGFLRPLEILAERFAERFEVFFALAITNSPLAVREAPRSRPL